MIKRLLRLVGRWARKPVNHTSWVAVVTPTDRPKSVRNRCLIELFCGVVCVVTLPFWHFCWCRGFCHRTESDRFLFLFQLTVKTPNIRDHLSVLRDRQYDRKCCSRFFCLALPVRYFLCPAIKWQGALNVCFVRNFVLPSHKVCLLNSSYILACI